MDMQQYEKQLTWDEPIQYKEILIYPVSMYNYIDFFMAINCLLIKKNQIPDPKIISKSYLDFLIYLIENSPQLEGQIYSSMLVKILELCLNINLESESIIYKKNDKGKSILVISYKDRSLIINKEDFDVIKDIICCQNVPYYDDSYIDPELEKALQEVEEFKSRNSKKKCSLEDQIVCIMISTSYKRDEIKNLTIRKFAKILERVDYKLHYEIYKTASMSGFVEFKGEIDHWMSDLTPDKFAGKITELNQFKDKINSING